MEHTVQVIQNNGHYSLWVDNNHVSNAATYDECMYDYKDWLEENDPEELTKNKE